MIQTITDVNTKRKLQSIGPV